MGLEVKLVIARKQQQNEDGGGDNDAFEMQVESSGKFSRKANWDDLKRFTGKDITSDVLRDMIVTYQQKCFPDDCAKPNSTPKKCFIKDEKGSTLYKDFGWKPIKLNLSTGMIDIKEKWTKEVVLETFPLDYTTNLEKVLLEKGDRKVTSILRKSKLAGHPLAKEMMTTKSEIVTEFEGELDATTCVLGNTAESSEIDEETGDEVWKDVKSLRALLHGATLPKKSGVGVTRDVDVLANESYLKARVYYKASFVNDVATDHVDPFDGKPYWKFPIKFLFQYNDIPNAAVVYEDIELRFFTEVRIAMDNKDFEWVKDENGQWKKQYAVTTTSVSQVKVKSIAAGGAPSNQTEISKPAEEQATAATEKPVDENIPTDHSSNEGMNESEAVDINQTDKKGDGLDDNQSIEQPIEHVEKASESAADTKPSEEVNDPLAVDLDRSMGLLDVQCESTNAKRSNKTGSKSSIKAFKSPGAGGSKSSIKSFKSPGAGGSKSSIIKSPGASINSIDSLKSPKPDPDGLNLSSLKVDADVPFQDSPKRDP